MARFYGLAGLTARVTRLLDKERNMETRMNVMSRTLMFLGSAAVFADMATVVGMGLARAEPTTEKSLASMLGRTTASPTPPRGCGW